MKWTLTAALLKFHEYGQMWLVERRRPFPVNMIHYSTMTGSAYQQMRRISDARNVEL